MHLYVELWNARPAWLALSAEERGAYFEQVGPAIEQLTNAGVEIVGWAINDDDTPHSSGHTYIAVWKMPNLELVKMLEEIVEGAGWYNYFDQINARGELVGPPPLLEHMAQL